jgi:hypothetical protein
MKWIAILDGLFGCHHSHLSRVFTINRRSYRVCCDCGAKFDYSLETMSIEGRDFSEAGPALCYPTSLTST